MELINFSSLQSLENALETAKKYSELSVATKKKVGAVLVKQDRVIGVGYNATANGKNEQCDDFTDNVWTTYSTVAHAEEDIITYSARHGIKTDECSIVVTHAPCFPCCRLMLKAGIIEVIFDVDYYDTTGYEYMAENGVNVHDYNKLKEL